MRLADASGQCERCYAAPTNALAATFNIIFALMNSRTGHGSQQAANRLAGVIAIVIIREKENIIDLVQRVVE